jgi:Holliday junction resolvase RusA-like endonuclease
MIRVAFTVPGDPVGVNQTYRRSAGAGLHKSLEAVSYAQAIALAGRQAWGAQEPMRGPVRVFLDLFFSSERSDIDGPVKALLDGLQPCRLRPPRPGAGIIADDRQVATMVLRRHLDRERPRVEVQVEAIAGVEPAVEPRRAARSPREESEAARRAGLAALLSPRRRAAMVERRLRSSVRRPA